jgi:hypothetical protein
MNLIYRGNKYHKTASTIRMKTSKIKGKYQGIISQILQLNPMFTERSSLCLKYRGVDYQPTSYTLTQSRNCPSIAQNYKK